MPPLMYNRLYKYGDCYISNRFSASSGRSAKSSTSSTVSTKWNVNPLRYFELISSISFLLASERIISAIPARFAARIFSFIPPTGSTFPAMLFLRSLLSSRELSYRGKRRQEMLPLSRRQMVRLSGSHLRAHGCGHLPL